MNEKQRQFGKKQTKKNKLGLNRTKEKAKLNFHKGSDRKKEETSYVRPCGEFEFERELERRR